MVIWSAYTLAWQVHIFADTYAWYSNTAHDCMYREHTRMHQWTPTHYTLLDKSWPGTSMGSWMERWTRGQEGGVKRGKRWDCGPPAEVLMHLRCLSQWGSIAAQYNEQLTLNLLETSHKNEQGKGSEIEEAKDRCLCFCALDMTC